MVCCSSGHGDQLPGYTEQASNRMQAPAGSPGPRETRWGRGSLGLGDRNPGIFSTLLLCDSRQPLALSGHVQ